MTRPPYEVADIVRRHGDHFLETHRAWLSSQHRRVLRALVQCRTAALGGHRDRCEQCAQPAFSYNSCRNRHCPKCLTATRHDWVAAREQALLPVGYLHVVFTRPAMLARLALVNKRVIYDLLFRAAAATLLQVAANPKRLGAAIGGLRVLHTWGQRLQHHPHVHCVVPGGGLSPDGARWIHTRPTFFLPVPVLRQVYRGQLGAGRRKACAQRQLQCPGVLQPLATEAAFRALLRSLYRQAWVVSAKPPFGSPAHVLHSLARYTHRVAISNHRLVAVTDDTVSFRWKDDRHGRQIRTLTLDAGEFLRRFLLHVLPKGFVRIRYFGLLAARCRTHALAQCRQALAVDPTPPPAGVLVAPRPRRTWPCPRCGAPMRVVERLTARQIFLETLTNGLLYDSSSVDLRVRPPDPAAAPMRGRRRCAHPSRSAQCAGFRPPAPPRIPTDDGLGACRETPPAPLRRVCSRLKMQS